MSPKTGARMASEAAWLKMVPRAIAEGLTGGRSAKICLSTVCTGDLHSRRLDERKRKGYVKGGVVQKTLVIQWGYWLDGWKDRIVMGN